MAVVSTKQKGSFSIKFQTYDAEQEKNVIKTKTYGNVNPSATNDSIVAVGKALAELGDITPHEFIRTDRTALSE